MWGLEPCHELFNGTKGQCIACDIPIETPFTNYVQYLNNLQPKGGARIFLASRDAVYKNYCTWQGGKPCKIMQNSCTCCIVHQPAYPSLYPETGLWIGEGLNPDAHQDMLCSTFERSWSIATTFHRSLARCHFRRGNVCAVLTSTQRMARHQGVRCARWRERHHQVAKPKLGVKMS